MISGTKDVLPSPSPPITSILLTSLLRDVITQSNLSIKTTDEISGKCSQTCEQRPPKGDIGVYKQVVFI